MKYHGGPLLRRVRVITLFWGPDWKQSALSAYFNSFFKALFSDGRFMANLAQYSTSDYTIDNGVFAGSYTDPQAPPSTIEDSDVEADDRTALGSLRLDDLDRLAVAEELGPSCEAFRGLARPLDRFLDRKIHALALGHGLGQREDDRCASGLCRSQR